VLQISGSWQHVSAALQPSSGQLIQQSASTQMMRRHESSDLKSSTPLYREIRLRGQLEKHRSVL